MRNRTPDSTTPLDPAKIWAFSVTEKGMRACGATTMMDAAARLHQMAAELEKAAERLNQEISSKGKRTKDVRRGTVCGRYRDHSKSRVPDLRLSGKWLGSAGFALGQKYQILVKNGQLTICAE